MDTGLKTLILPAGVAAVAGAPGLAAIPLRNPVIPWELEIAWPRKAILSPAAQALLDLAGRAKIPSLHAGAMQK